MKTLILLLIVAVAAPSFAGKRNRRQVQYTYSNQRTQQQYSGHRQMTYSQNNGGGDLVSMINNYRAQHGLRPLANDPSVAIADGGGHGNFRGTGSGVANWSGTTDARATFNMWQNSSGHRANMLNPNITRAGIATGGFGTTFTGR